jgi:hypothetical protein
MIWLQRLDLRVKFHVDGLLGEWLVTLDLDQGRFGVSDYTSAENWVGWLLTRWLRLRIEYVGVSLVDWGGLTAILVRFHPVFGFVRALLSTVVLVNADDVQGLSD